MIIDREKMERASVERQLKEKTREVAELQSQLDGHSAELNAR